MRRILLAIILYLLMSSIANAECAWVWWESLSGKVNLLVSTRPYQIYEGKGDWVVKKAFPNYKDCTESLNEYKMRMTEILEREKKYRDGLDDPAEYGVKKIYSIVVLDDGIDIYYFHRTPEDAHAKLMWMCLPDTIDPRK